MSLKQQHSSQFRSPWVGLGLGFALLGNVEAAAPTPQSLLEAYWAVRKPNIIFILASHLEAHELGSYGASPSQTPHLDQLAAEGMRFTQCYAGSPEIKPAMATLLTGRHTGHLAARGTNDFALAPTAMTVAKVLKQSRYTTGALGRWGLGQPFTSGIPNKQGFDEWLGFLSLKHAEDHYPTQLWRNVDILPFEKNFYHYRGFFVQDIFTMAATNFVRINKLKPFFLYLPLTLPGNPQPAQLAAPPTSAGAKPAKATQATRSRARMIQQLDAAVGALLDALRSRKLDRHTVVFFSSVKGIPDPPPKPASSNTVQARASRPNALSETSLRVPMIAWWPGKIPAGKVSDQVWAFWDFLPTAAAIAEVKPLPNTDGVSILPTLLAQPQTNQPPFLYWESHRYGFQQALRLGPWKCLRRAPGQKLELYHLASDPKETKNVAADHPQIVGRMEKSLRLRASAK